jgi:hypothetical protein
MDELLTAAGVVVPIAVALTAVLWWMLASARHRRRRWQRAAECTWRYPLPVRVKAYRPAHMLGDHSEAVTVAKLLDNACERGESVRLNWPVDEMGESELVRPNAQDEFPTAVLPPVDDNGERAGLTAQPGVTRRNAKGR